jgi:hypothetical protein
MGIPDSTIFGVSEGIQVVALKHLTSSRYLWTTQLLREHWLNKHWRPGSPGWISRTSISWEGRHSKSREEALPVAQPRSFQIHSTEHSYFPPMGSKGPLQIELRTYLCFDQSGSGLICLMDQVSSLAFMWKYLKVSTAPHCFQFMSTFTSVDLDWQALVC